jgi:D-alanyl-D-alanine carboxypeptidase
MHKHLARICVVCCISACLNTAALSQAALQPHALAAAQLKQKLQQKLDEWHAAGKFPGATLGVILADGTNFGLATGLSDLTLKKPMTPRDRLLQGSVGKTYVAAVALQLVQEGKLGLDDKIERYLGQEPWFTRLPNAPDITVRMLMNHTSGLVRYEFNPKFLADLTANPAKVWKPLEEIAYLFDTKAAFAAGQGWDYSDTNYIVLGMIIERLTKSTYYRQVRKRILNPLKLTDTVPSDSRHIPGLAQGYAGEKNPFGGADAMLVNGAFAINPQFEWTGGGMASTSAELARWGKLLYEGKAFDPSLLSEMFNGVPARLGPETKYGLGVIIRPTSLGLAYGHSGFFPGYLTEMLYFPAHKFALALQINTSVGSKVGRSPLRVLLEFAEMLTAN